MAPFRGKGRDFRACYEPTPATLASWFLAPKPGADVVPLVAQHLKVRAAGLLQRLGHRRVVGHVQVHKALRQTAQSQPSMAAAHCASRAANAPRTAPRARRKAPCPDTPCLRAGAPAARRSASTSPAATAALPPGASGQEVACSDRGYRGARHGRWAQPYMAQSPPPVMTGSGLCMGSRSLSLRAATKWLTARSWRPCRAFPGTRPAAAGPGAARSAA